MARSQLERGLAIVELLFGHVLDGMKNSEICSRLRMDAISACRTLEALERAKWVRQTDRGGWVLTEKPVALMKVFQAYQQEYHERMTSYAARTDAQAKQMIR